VTIIVCKVFNISNTDRRKDGCVLALTLPRLSSILWFHRTGSRTWPHFHRSQDTIYTTLLLQ